MDDYRNDNIIYDEGWQKVSIPQVAEILKDEEKAEPESTEKHKKKERKKYSFPALISIQLVVCLMIAVVIFTLKYMDSGLFSTISDWYHKLNETILVPNSKFENFDLSKYLEATKDEIAATKDEI